MKASLEPKEQQIENLKEQLLELEQVFEKQSKALLGLEEDVKRREMKIVELRGDQVTKKMGLIDQEKVRTKEKERTVQRFVNDIHKIVQIKGDEKGYVTGLMRIYE